MQLLLLGTSLALAGLCSAQNPTFGQWCGKYYQVGAPMPTSRPAGSLFQYPETSNSPLLDFRCTTKSSIYIEGDDMYDPPMLLVDTNITYDVGQAYSGSMNGSVRVDLWSDDNNYLTGGSVPLNSLGNLLPFNISSLKAGKTKYNLTCKASIDGQTFYTNSTLSYLPPNPNNGSTVKIDRLSGTLLVRNETAGTKTWEKLIPYGFYDSYNSTSDPTVYGSGYGTNAVNDTLSRLHLAKSLGMTLVHPVPPGGFAPYTFDDDATAQFNQYLDTAESLGLWVQYDMRNSYTNLSSVEYQVGTLLNRSNLLIWYTGDEPDGAGDPLNATQLAYEKIYETDGYHPVSLVLNCENYYFENYGANGADVIMVDPYPIAMNARWSKPYDTIVDENFGDSGCDNCNGTFYDISTRIESTRNRARVLGEWRNKPAWIVPQSFNDGQQEFWFRVPYGQEGQAMTSVLAWNHGGVGSVAWNSQYSSMDLLGNASVTANLLYNVSRFVVDAYDSRQEILSNLSYPGINGVDIASWTIPGNGSSKSEILVMAVNQGYGPNDSPTWQQIFNLANSSATLKQTLYGNITTNDTDGTPLFFMPRTSIAVAILEE